LTSKEFIKNKLKELSGRGVKNFPDNFLFPCEVNEITLPPESLIIGNELFGNYEVITIKGHPFCHTDTLLKAKYIVYAGKQKDRKIKIPVNERDIEAAIKNYEKYLDTMLRETEKDYRKLFPENKDVNNIVNEVFRLLNLNRL